MTRGVDSNIARGQVVWLCLIVLLSSRVRPAEAQSAAQLRHATLTARLLAYDRALVARAGKQLVVAVLHPKGGANEGKELEAAFRRLSSFTIQSLHLQTTRLTFHTESALDVQVKALDVDVLFVCRGLSQASGAITKVSRANRALTVYTDPGYSKKGLSLGLFTVAGKTKITINFRASRAEGVRFASALLRIATVIGR